MTRIMPAFKFHFFGSLRILAAGQSRIRIAAVRTDQAVDHQLQRAGRLVPMDRAEDHHAMCGDPTRINFRHPIVDLSHSMVGIAGAGPVAQWHRRRDAGLTWINYSTVFRCKPAQVEKIYLETLVS